MVEAIADVKAELLFGRSETWTDAESEIIFLDGLKSN